MSSQEPRLRGSARRRSGPYPLGEIPDGVVRKIGQQLIHRIAVGHADIAGNDFGTIFANGVGGEHRSKPLGVADVVLNGCAWSVKTVQNNIPFTTRAKVRLILGRNSPVYSLGITDPYENLGKTGNAVLSVWNARVDEAFHEYDDLRIVVMVRNLQAKQFVIFEEEASRFTPADYRWVRNKNDNLEGFDIAQGIHCFTWQPHGSQFTFIRQHIPPSARRFSIDRNIRTVATVSEVLEFVGYTDEWITFHD